MATVTYGGVYGGVSDKVLFVGPNVPNEIKSLGKLLGSIDKHTFRSLVKLIISDFEGRTVTSESYTSLKKASKKPEILDTIFSGLYTLLQIAYRIPEGALKQETFKDDLQELRIPNDFSPDLVSVVFGSSVLSRVLQPTILIELTCYDGKKRTFEVSSMRFHQLRLAVATLLQEMMQLEQRNVLKAV